MTLKETIIIYIIAFTVVVGGMACAFIAGVQENKMYEEQRISASTVSEGDLIKVSNLCSIKGYIPDPDDKNNMQLILDCPEDFLLSGYQHSK